MAEDYLHRGKKYVKQGTVKIDKSIRFKIWFWRILYTVVFFTIVGLGSYGVFKVLDKPIYYNNEWYYTTDNDKSEINIGDRVLIGPEPYTFSTAIGYLTKNIVVSEVQIKELPNSIVSLDKKKKTKATEYIGECIQGECEAGKMISLDKEQILYKK